MELGRVLPQRPAQRRLAQRRAAQDLFVDLLRGPGAPRRRQVIHIHRLIERRLLESRRVERRLARLHRVSALGGRRGGGAARRSVELLELVAVPAGVASAAGAARVPVGGVEPVPVSAQVLLVLDVVAVLLLAELVVAESPGAAALLPGEQQQAGGQSADRDQRADDGQQRSAASRHRLLAAGLRVHLGDGGGHRQGAAAGTQQLPQPLGRLGHQRTDGCHSGGTRRRLQTERGKGRSDMSLVVSGRQGNTNGVSQSIHGHMSRSCDKTTVPLRHIIDRITEMRPPKSS